MKVMNPLTEITLACAVLVSSARAAISPAIDGNTWTFTVASGVTETNSTALSGAVDVVKEGAGRLVLDTASTAFDGTVVVRGGTLEIKDAGALGATSVPISVEDGGRLLLSLPGSTKFGHVITIAGTGADSAAPYAFDYNRTSTDNSDSLIDGLVLADDATIVVRKDQRWGVANGGTIELGGHTLTRKGGGAWMIKNIDVKSTGGAGTVVNTAGTLTFQGRPQVAENVTFDTTSGSGVVGLWAVEKSADIAGTVSLAANRTLQAQSGNNAGDNRLGCVHFAGSATISTTFDKAARSMTVENLSGASDVAPTNSGIGSLYVTGNVALGDAGNFTAKGGYLYFNGDDSERHSTCASQPRTRQPSPAGTPSCIPCGSRAAARRAASCAIPAASPVCDPATRPASARQTASAATSRWRAGSSAPAIRCSSQRRRVLSERSARLADILNRGGRRLATPNTRCSCTSAVEATPYSCRPAAPTT